jgi:hypothetical protein
MMEFDNFYKWYSTIDLCDPMIGSYEKIIEFNSNEKEVLKFDFELKAKSKFKAYIKNIFNYSIKLKSYRGKPIKCNDDEEEDDENNMIYTFLDKGVYSIEIRLNDKITKDVIYLEIYCYEELNDNNMIYNNIINIGKNFSDVYLENNFIQDFINKFYFFIKNNDLDIFGVPNKNDKYFNSREIKLNFFVNYYNTKKGYYSEIIYKYNWTYLWIVDSKYEYDDYYNILTKYGNCRCYRNSGNFVFSHFNFEFKNNIFNGNITKNEINWSEKIKYEKKEMIGAILGNIQYLIDKDKKRIVNKNIDIVYLMDSTGSMGEEVKIASNLLIKHAQSLYKNNPEYDFQFGFVYYNDPIDANTDYNDYLFTINKRY